MFSHVLTDEVYGRQARCLSCELHKNTYLQHQALPCKLPIVLTSSGEEPKDGVVSNIDVCMYVGRWQAKG